MIAKEMKLDRLAVKNRLRKLLKLMQQKEETEKDQNEN
jgi:hypothetical protein